MRNLLQLLVLAGLASAAHAETAISLEASVLVQRLGTNSGAPLDVLAERDQWNTMDDPNKYLELGPASRGYRADFEFQLPQNVATADIAGITLDVAYRGPAKSQQVWRWRLYDFQRSRWATLGDNSFAPPWTWEGKSFPLKGNPGSFINSQRKLKLRYLTDSSYAESQLDYMELQVSLMGEDPQDPVEPPSSVEPPPSSPGVWKPTPGTTWQWQLTGKLDTRYDVDVYDIDLFDNSASTITNLHNQGRKVICYFSAGTWEDWRPDAGQFSSAVKGNKNGWPGERWVDIRNIDILGPIMAARLDLARSKGCDGVEPDNIDGYTNNTGFPLTAANQRDYNEWLAAQAHARGLSIGLKNDIDQAALLQPHFDFAINEQCFQYNECDALTSFVAANKAVFGVEYSGDPAKFCPKANALLFSWLMKNLDLGPEGLSCKSEY